MIEPFVENLLYSNLKNEEYKNLIYCSINLLLQITTEYLSYSQNKLEEENNKLKNQMKDQNKNYEKIIKDYKRSKKKKMNY
jgi:hypothetical protein